MGVILTVANQKGGVGKTTTACALAAAFAKVGKRSLLCDCDPQCNSTDTARAAVDGAATLYDLLLEDAKPADCIQKTAVYDVIACDPLLRDADKKLDGISGVYRLKERLSPIAELYDVVVMDTPPGLGVMLTGALTASDAVIVPVTADRYALQGMTQLVKSIADVRKYTNPALRVAGLLINRLDTRTSLSKQIAGSLPELAAQLETVVLDTRIRQTVKAQEAQSARLSLLEWAPDCSASQDYMALAEELMKKGVV